MKLNDSIRDLRVTSSLKQQIKRISEDTGMTIPQVARILLLESVKRVPKDKDGRFQLSITYERREI
jgi:antitoxin component of RelBE/YafQ-DinJ toxin-antitoxin module